MPSLEYAFIMYEIWKEIAGFEDYQISNLGRVRSLPLIRPHPQGKRKWPGKILSTYRGSNKYRACSLWNPGDKKPTYFRVHVLVAETFIGPKPGLKFEVNHKDGVKPNCSVKNLEWITRAKNMEHATIVLKVRGKKLNPKQVVKIKSELKLYHGQIGFIKKLANKFNVSIHTIHAINNKRTWNHV